MMHEGQRIEQEIKRLERELEAPIRPERRMQIGAAINELRRKKASWERPH